MRGTRTLPFPLSKNLFPLPPHHHTHIYPHVYRNSPHHVSVKAWQTLLRVLESGHLYQSHLDQSGLLSIQHALTLALSPSSASASNSSSSSTSSAVEQTKKKQKTEPAGNGAAASQPKPLAVADANDFLLAVTAVFALSLSKKVGGFRPTFEIYSQSSASLLALCLPHLQGEAKAQAAALDSMGIVALMKVLLGIWVDMCEAQANQRKVFESMLRALPVLMNTRHAASLCTGESVVFCVVF